MLVAQSVAVYAQAPEPFGFFVNNTIYQPTGNQSVTYPRFTELQDGTILATTSFSGPVPPYFPIFESKDGGASWEYISDLTDQVNGWGMSAQPALAELLSPIGGFDVGTILASGNSWNRNGTNGGTKIDLYASLDRGRSWQFVSNVAEGGPPNTTNGATPIWEPWIQNYNGAISVHYSDQRDPLHGQKLAHQVSYDLQTWGPVVNDVAIDEYLARPGMTVIAYVPPIGKWILVHELPIGNSSSYGANYPVYYHLADDPWSFRFSEGIPIVINGKAPNASPYVVWTPYGGEQGTIIVSDADSSSVYVNRCGGCKDEWEEKATPAGAVYSRAIHVLGDYPDHLMIFGGETFDDLGLGLLKPFSATVVDLGVLLGEGDGESGSGGWGDA